MAAVAALITLETPAIDEPMLMAIAAGAPKTIRPASLLQSRLKLFFSAVEPLELRRREIFAAMNAIGHHDRFGIYVPARAAR